jgi:sodium transport system permease protein
MTDHAAGFLDNSRALGLSGGAALRPQGWGVWATLGWWASISLVGVLYVIWSAHFDTSHLFEGTRISLGYALTFLVCLAEVAIIVLATRLTGIPARDYLGLVRPRRGDIWRGVGFGVILWIAAIVIALVLKAYFGSLAPAAAATSTSAMVPWDVAYKVFAVLFVVMSNVVLTPISEELLDRGFLYRGLEPRLGGIGAIVITALMFGLSHKLAFGWDWVVAMCVVGLVLGWLRRRSGGVTLTIVTHATMNTPATLLGMVEILWWH